MSKLVDGIGELVLYLESVESILEKQPGDVVKLEEDRNEILKQIIALASSGFLKPDILCSYINILGLSTRIHKNLARENIFTIKDLIQKTERDLLCIQGIGDKSLKKISEGLARVNLKLGTKLDMD